MVRADVGDAQLRRLLLFAALALVGCGFEPTDDTPFTPPASYRALFDSAEACSGRHGDFRQLRFFTLPGWSFQSPAGPAAGYTQGTTIWIAENWVNNNMVVKHEMIHALGVHHHPYHPFVDPCHATWASYREAE
jgi:hypothetical protein